MPKIILTDAGSSLLTATLTNKNTVVTFTKMELSSTTVNQNTIESTTKLNHVEQTMPFSEVTRLSDSMIRLVADFKNQGITDDFYVFTAGLYAQSIGNEEVLFAIVDLRDEPDFQPAFDGKHVARIHYTFHINVDDTEGIEVTYTTLTSAEEVTYSNDIYTFVENVDDMLDNLCILAKRMQDYMASNDAEQEEMRELIEDAKKQLKEMQDKIDETIEGLYSALEEHKNATQGNIDSVAEQLQSTIDDVQQAKDTVDKLVEFNETNTWGDDMHVLGNATIDQLSTGTGGFSGNLTGNVTGNVTGSLTGTASEATHAKNADTATTATKANSVKSATTCGTADTAKACSGNAATATKATNADHATNADTCKTCSGNAATATTATNANHATNADSATKATNDGNNRNIVNTYGLLSEYNSAKSTYDSGKTAIVNAIKNKGQSSATTSMTWDQLANLIKAITTVSASSSLGAKATAFSKTLPKRVSTAQSGQSSYFTFITSQSLSFHASIPYTQQIFERNYTDITFTHDNTISVLDLPLSSNRTPAATSSVAKPTMLSYAKTWRLTWTNTTTSTLTITWTLNSLPYQGVVIYSENDRATADAITLACIEKLHDNTFYVTTPENSAFTITYTKNNYTLKIQRTSGKQTDLLLMDIV